MLISGDVGDEFFCQAAIKNTAEELGHLDILINNAGEQHPHENIEGITKDQLERTFRTNIFSFFYMTKAAAEHDAASMGSFVKNCLKSQSLNSHYVARLQAKSREPRLIEDATSARASA